MKSREYRLDKKKFEDRIVMMEKIDRILTALKCSAYLRFTT